MATRLGLSVAAAVHARVRPCWERIIAERYCSGSLRSEDALHLFDELLPRTRPTSVTALSKLLTVVARPEAESFSPVCDGPVLVVSLFNRMARAGANKVAPDIYTYCIAAAATWAAWTSDLPSSV
jgi:hypothetical protein